MVEPNTSQHEPSHFSTTVPTISGNGHAASAILFVFAFLVRVVHNQWIAASPIFTYKIGDANKYDLWAREISEGNWLGTEIFYQAPLYPYFLASLYTLFGDGIMTVRLVQAILGAAACVFMMNAVFHLFDRRAGIAAGIIMSIYAPSIFLESLVQKSVLDVFFLSAMLWLLSKAIAGNRQNEKRGKWWVWIGFTTGLLCLTRENALVAIPVLGMWALLSPAQQSPSRSVKRRLATGIALLMGLFLALGPVALRNYVVGGEFHLTTSQMGPNFFIGNNPNADGTYSPLRAGRGDAKFERQDAIEIAEAESGRALTAGEVSDFYMAKSWDFISTEPVSWLQLMGWKTLLTMNATELVDTEDQYTHARWSPVLTMLNPVAHFGWLVPLGMLGMWITRTEWKRLWWAYLLLGAFTASVIGFFVFGRYRFPMVPLLVLFAAPATVYLIDVYQERGIRGVAKWAPAFAAIFVLCNLPLVDKTLAKSITLSNFGKQALIRDNVDLAEQFLHESISLKPDNSVAHCNLAVLYWKKGQRPDLAEKHFELALKANPNFQLAIEKLTQLKKEISVRTTP